MSKRWIRRARGGLEEDRRRDGSARRRRTSLEMESRHRKVGQVPTRPGAWNVGRRRRVARGDARMAVFQGGFPPTCKSASCASKFEVSNRRRASQKKSSAARRSDGDDNSGGGFQKENKVI